MATISQSRLSELLAAESQLKAIQSRESIRWVGEALGNAYATQLALTPWHKWTDGQKNLLCTVCGNAETARQLYISCLPK